MPGAVATPKASLTSLHRYPVKSCRGEALQKATVERWGLTGDRRWMLVDQAGEAVTARQLARLVLVTPLLTDDGLLLMAPGAEPLEVPRPDAGPRLSATLFDRPVPATLASAEAAAWFSGLADRPVRLVYLDAPAETAPGDGFGDPGERASFADGYPLLLANQESLAELNRWIAEGRRASDGPLPMSRFRPNLVVSGVPAWEEDRWRRVRIGSATFRSVKACDRCVLTLVDPETATKTKEPLFSLARHRQWDHKTWFAVNLIPDTVGQQLSVGDDVEVLEQVDDPTPQH
jgi:hypothetical protein